MVAARVSPQFDYQAELGLDIKLSPHQLAIFEWVRTGRGNAVVDAVAGAGKTSTSVWAARLMRGSGLYCAFNKKNADELERRLAGTQMVASTVHRHGLGALRWHAYSRRGLNGRVQVVVDRDEQKYPAMFEAAITAILDRAPAEVEPGTDGEENPKPAPGDVVSSLCGEPVTGEQLDMIRDPEGGFPISECVELCRLARLTLINFDSERFGDALYDLAGHYDVAVDDLLWPLVVVAVRNALRLGCEVPKQGEWLVDFTDMLWLPIVLRLRPKQYDWIIVDECQDISTAARRLLLASVSRYGRMLWIGDPHQAINGFAGADCDSFEAIIREARAVVLPLSVCYRCPTSHLEIARQWRPDIRARDGAPRGTITRMDRGEYIDEARPGDMVICRRTAPLVHLCFELIASGVSASVTGRADVSKGLIKLVKSASNLAPKGEWSATFGKGLDAYREREKTKLERRGRTPQSIARSLEALNDRIECVRIVFQSCAATSRDQLIDEVTRIFADEDAAVTLSTVHRAKGLEADRVAILEYDRLQSFRATQDWQIEQEENLAYVAYTRAKAELITIPAPKRGEE